MKKRILILTLLLCLTLALLPLSAQAAEVIDSGKCGQNLSWTLTSEGTLTIAGTGKMLTYTTQSPWVSKYSSEIKEVILENGIESIGKYAFVGCTNVARVTIPGSVVYIESMAFENCTGLTELVLQEGLKTIQNSAFRGCSSLSSITIPKTVTWINYEAFALCTGLSKVTFMGSAPRAYDGYYAYAPFSQNVYAECYYPKDDPSWTEAVKASFGGGLNWIAYEANTEPAPTEPAEDTPRIAGGNRFETANLVADQMKKNLGIEKFDTVVVASGTEFADALAGSYLATVKKAPILLAYSTEKINAGVKDYIKANLNEGGTVYILGGPNAVPESFEEGLEGFAIKRLAGAHRFETNLMVLKEAGIGDNPLLVATGLTFADSLSASAAKLPILLVYGDKLLPEQEAFLSENQGRNLYILGGEGAVNAKMEAVLTAYGTVERVAGENRFETSVKIAEKFFENPESAVLAYAWDFPDGLCGGPLAVTMNAPLILTMEKYEAKATAYIQGEEIARAVILGGEKLIPQSSIDRIFPRDTLHENELPIG